MIDEHPSRRGIFWFKCDVIICFDNLVAFISYLTCFT